MRLLLLNRCGKYMQVTVAGQLSTLVTDSGLPLSMSSPGIELSHFTMAAHP